MNRLASLDYLADQFSDLADEAGFDGDKTLRAYSLVIDKALRLLGYREDELASADTDNDETGGFLSALDYFALDRYLKAFSTRTDVSMSGAISASQSQAFVQVGTLFEEAKTRLESFGLSPRIEAMSVGFLTLDFLEPSLEESGGW